MAMALSSSSRRRKRVESSLLVFLCLFLCSFLDLVTAHQGHSHSESNIHHHHCGGGDGHHHHHHHHHDHDDHDHDHDHGHVRQSMLPEELAEEEDMKLYGFGLPHHDLHFTGSTELSGLGLWLNALGCSFLVSMASLICLILLPVIFIQGKPSKAVVDSLALFGAGAMLGDAFLHQLPHAFGGEHSHSHSDHADHDHGHDASSGHGHSHSLADLSTGMSILAGIVLFLLVEKLVRYVEENSGGANSWGHGHHHHNHNSKKKLEDDNNSDVNNQSQSIKTKKERLVDEGKEDNQVSHDSLKGDKLAQTESSLRKRIGSNTTKDDSLNDNAEDSSTDNIKPSIVKEPVRPASSLVFGYLNLFSDGVHNFTDGIALGSAFMLHGSVGGWSRTLFLLAHEIPQEVGDFGILIRSGFSIPKALFFNFLSALVALAGTALALVWGKDPGQSSLIEGFTAGGFIYIAIAGVLAEMNNNGKTTFRSTAVHIISLTMGMAVALGISLIE
ncbi:IAA-alanine resistance protein 1 [Lathyrus oleraceus]|uniref:IAA-alanine resistance protein 1 n=2 Tax=Pisum sativum TaxID=3888 RepID=A0A9D4VLC9_PEA|nr:IAA-alanine resistance protein 1 [Pisum sativum]XP_050894309.1 IAA-alanine resistance protein 1 [Pisum sativum]KAI5385398.1 IAA-alanine resistance protein 1 [Pisum sativum]